MVNFIYNGKIMIPYPSKMLFQQGFLLANISIAPSYFQEKQKEDRVIEPKVFPSCSIPCVLVMHIL